VNPDLVAHFWAFVQERQAIWHRRFVLQQPRPWTDDQVLQKEHITNVYRWLDPGTQYAIQALNAAPSHQDQLFFAVAYRLLNRREVFERFGRPPYLADREEWLAFLESERAAKRPIFTRRHLTPYWRQYTSALERVPTLTVEGASPMVFDQLRRLGGVGTFIGWQVYADLTYVPGFMRFHETFVMVGDGAAFALSLLDGSRTEAIYRHERNESKGGRVRPSDREQPVFAEKVVHLFRTQPKIDAADPSWPPLSVIDIEHALCEWLRYRLALHRASKETSCASS
jgi:hypothetical protein